MTTLYEMLGLPGAAELGASRRRTQDAFAGLLGPPGSPLEQATGLPAPPSMGRGRFDKGLEGGAASSLIEDEGGRWWPWGVAVIVGVMVYEALDHPIEESEDLSFELPGWEIDGIPWTVDVLHQPGPQYAARVAEPMLHGGQALPGPGSTDVNIGGRGALTVSHAVAACPGTNIVGLPHIPQAGSWMTTNTASVNVNGVPLLRAGDWMVEHFGGCNPLIGGMPTVKAGPPARPCITQEVRYFGLPGPLERVGSKGTKIKVTGSVRWNLRSVLATGVAGGLMVATGGNPVGRWGAGLILKNTERPSIELEIEGSSEHYADLRGELDGDGEDVQARLVVKNKCSAKQSAGVDPNPPRKTEAGQMETDCDAPDFDIEFPDEDPS